METILNSDNGNACNFFVFKPFTSKSSLRQYHCRALMLSVCVCVYQVSLHSWSVFVLLEQALLVFAVIRV